MIYQPWNVMIILAYHCGIALHTLKKTLHGSSTTAPVAKRSGKALAVNSGPARDGSAIFSVWNDKVVGVLNQYMGIWSTYSNMDFLETCRDIDLKPATWYLRFGCIWKSWHNGNIRGKHRMSESYAWLCHVSSAGKNPRDQPLGTTPDPEWRTGSVSDARRPFELSFKKHSMRMIPETNMFSSSNCGNQLREISNCLKNGETY